MFYRVINETLLEMYFFQELRQLFQNKFNTEKAIMLKPSTISEAWYGFDQGWVATKYGHKEILNDIRKAIHNKKTTVDSIYIAYFLQFKVVEVMFKSSRYAPRNITVPYYRSELSVQPNENTRLSQHETLRRLQNIAGCDVFYACGMIFEPDEIWEVADINKLRLVTLRDCTDNYTDGARHFIVFQSTSSDPIWCSDPVRGRALNLYQWASGESQENITPYQVLRESEIPAYLNKLSERSRRELHQWIPSQLRLLYLAKKLT